MATFTLVIATPLQEGIQACQVSAESPAEAIREWVEGLQAARIDTEKAYGFPSLEHLRRAAEDQPPMDEPEFPGVWYAGIRYRQQHIYLMVVQTETGS